MHAPDSGHDKFKFTLSSAGMQAAVHAPGEGDALLLACR